LDEQPIAQVKQQANKRLQVENKQEMAMKTNKI